MKKLRRTLPIILATSAILGILAVSGHAKKPSPPPEPTVTVAGVISGTGDPSAIQVTFDGSLAYEYPDDSTKGLVFISSPDYPPSLQTVWNAPRQTNLRYFYCTHEDHEGMPDLLCTDASHDPDYYYGLEIRDGIPNHKSHHRADQVTFPVGSLWRIWKKGWSVVAQGTLDIETTYHITK